MVNHQRSQMQPEQRDQQLTSRKLADASALQQIESEVRAEMQSAVDFAVAAPYPNPEEAEQDVYA